VYWHFKFRPQRVGTPPKRLQTAPRCSYTCAANGLGKGKQNKGRGRRGELKKTPRVFSTVTFNPVLKFRRGRLEGKRIVLSKGEKVGEDSGEGEKEGGSKNARGGG